MITSTWEKLWFCFVAGLLAISLAMRVLCLYSMSRPKKFNGYYLVESHGQKSVYINV